MSRPKKTAEERMTERIVFKVRPSDYLQAVILADKAGMTLSAYARQQFMFGRVIIKETRKLDYAAFEQLRRIGVNLNQITRRMHQTDRISPELDRICELLETVLMDNIDDLQSKKRPKL